MCIRDRDYSVYGTVSYPRKRIMLSMVCCTVLEIQLLALLRMRDYSPYKGMVPVLYRCRYCRHSHMQGWHSRRSKFARPISPDRAQRRSKFSTPHPLEGVKLGPCMAAMHMHTFSAPLCPARAWCLLFIF